MSYYIIVRATGLIATDGPNKSRSYKTRGAAQATRTRLCRKAGWTAGDLSIVDIKEYEPNIMIVGSDWKGKPIIGSQYAKELVYYERIIDESTTKTIESFINRRQMHR